MAGASRWLEAFMTSENIAVAAARRSRATGAGIGVLLPGGTVWGKKRSGRGIYAWGVKLDALDRNLGSYQIIRRRYDQVLQRPQRDVRFQMRCTNPTTATTMTPATAPTSASSSIAPSTRPILGRNCSASSLA